MKRFSSAQRASSKRWWLQADILDDKEQRIFWSLIPSIPACQIAVMQNPITRGARAQAAARDEANGDHKWWRRSSCINQVEKVPPEGRLDENDRVVQNEIVHPWSPSTLHLRRLLDLRAEIDNCCLTPSQPRSSYHGRELQEKND